jgi:hypothetical protein
MHNFVVRYSPSIMLFALLMSLLLLHLTDRLAARWRRRWVLRRWMGEVRRQRRRRAVVAACFRDYAPMVDEMRRATGG